MPSNQLLLENTGSVGRHSSKFAELVKKVAVSPSSAYFILKKRDILSFTPEERKLIAQRVERYLRNGYRLKPRSFTHFLVSPKYSLDDEVEVRVTAEALENLGILKITEKEGFKYWTACGELLPPKEYLKLYKLRRETAVTLLKEYGLLPFYEAFGGNMDFASCSFYVGVLANINYGGLRFELSPGRLYVSTDIGYDRREIGKTAFLFVSVENPKPDDVIRVARLTRELETKVKTEVDRTRETIHRMTGVLPDRTSFEGYMEVHNYKITKWVLRSDTRLERGRKVLRIYVERDYVKSRAQVVLEGGIRSQYVLETFNGIDFQKYVKVPASYSFARDRGAKTVYLMYRAESKGSAEIPNISDPFKVVSSVDGILLEILKMHINALKPAKIMAGSGRDAWETPTTVGEFLKSIGWEPGMPFDEAVLKLIATRTELPKNAKPDLFVMLVAWSVLEGHPQDKLMEKVNNDVETLIKYLRKGRLKIIARDNRKWLYLDGKPTFLCLDSNPLFGKVVRSVKLLLEDHEKEYKNFVATFAR